MTGQGEYSFTRYLAAKVTVDDRALNRHVWDTLEAQLPRQSLIEPLRVLEIGAGIGTMVERMVDWGLLRYAMYTAIDSQARNVEHAGRRLAGWARGKGVGEGLHSSRVDGGQREPRGNTGVMVVQGEDLRVEVALKAVDLYDFADREKEKRQWDLLVAHAFLDLVDVSSTLPVLFSLLKPGGMFYFTIVYDGLTVLEPEVDSAFDALVLELYHRTMDERVTNGRPSGGSRTGRHLIDHLRASGAGVLAAGSSDWVVIPGESGYPGDEAYFLHFIVRTIHQALIGHPGLEAARFEGWISERHAQVERGELVYIAHQMDFVGRVP
jgi:SAM-dependent methyltransferase